MIVREEFYLFLLFWMSLLYPGVAAAAGIKKPKRVFQDHCWVCLIPGEFTQQQKQNASSLTIISNKLAPVYAW